MTRETLIRETREVLAKAGFYLSDENVMRMICFDLVARRDNILVILKILSNVDSFTKYKAQELITVSNMLSGSPVLIGEHNSSKRIEPGIIYLRYGIPMLNSKTLGDFFLEGVPPLIFSAPGGFYVNIDGNALRDAREDKGVSLGTLAEVAGVSRKSIQMYENGMSTVIEIALRLEEYLKIPLIKSLDPFSFLKDVDNINIEFNKPEKDGGDIFSQLRALGYDVVPTVHCPFDALTKDKKVLIITGISDYDKKTAVKARILTNLSKITEQYSVIFLEKEVSKENLEGTPIIQKAELEKMDDSDEIITLISERS